MTAYVLSGACNIDQLGTLSPSGSASARAGGDTIDTNGFNFTIDQDTRGGLTGTTSTSFGNMTVNATKGGNIVIDGSAVRLIPYTGGSGNVPAWNSVITQSGQSGSGKLIGVYSALTAASTATGAAMPASGFIKVKQTTGTYASGALTGITATSSGADTVGWIDVVGDEAAGVIANRLGQVNITGAWFPLGTTSGASNQTMQIPNHGLLRYAAGVFIEKTAGQADYEFYPNAGTTTTTGTEATRGKVVWIDNTGLVRIGNSGAATNGYTPASGLAVVIPNVFLENCTTAARTANVIPNATVATRYDFTCTGGGVLNIDKCNMAWYLSAAQAYSVQLSNSGFVDAINVSEVATAMTWSKVGVGNKPTTALVVSPLTMALCFAGGTFTDCVFAMVSQSASGNHILTLTDIAGFTFTRCTIRANTIRGNATTFAINGTRMVSCTLTDCVVIQGSMTLTTCNGITVTGLTYCDAVSGTTVTTYAMYVWSILSNTINCIFSGLSFPVTNTHPYTALLNVAAAGCNNIKMRSIASRDSPLTLGSVNACGLIYILAAGAAASDIKIQRVYCSNTRTGIMTGDNSSTRVLQEQVFGDYADAVDVGAVLNFVRKGMGGTGALTAQTAVYGTHWRDGFTSTTAGRIAILMNEASSLTTAQVTLASGAAFTSAGGLYMPTIGMQAIFELPYYCIGHTAFQNSAGIMAGGTATNYTYQYQIDKNDGNGFSAWSADKTATTLATALNGEASISAVNGFKVKIKITTSTGNTTAITSFYLLTSSTTTTQAYQYPLDVNTLTLTGVLAGSEIRCFTGSPGAAAVEIGGIESSSGNFVLTHSSGGVSGFITIINVDRQAFNFGIDSAFSYTAADLSLPVSQVLERNYTP